MSAICPHCGGAISIILGVYPPQSPGVNPAQNGSIGPPYAESAQEISDPKPSTKSAYDQDFLTFWSIYPLRRDKGKAQNAWRKSVARVRAATGVNLAQAATTIAAGAARYRDDPNRDPSFTKYAEGWLNGDGWEDEPLPPRGQGRLTLAPSKRELEAEADAYMEDRYGPRA